MPNNLKLTFWQLQYLIFVQKEEALAAQEAARKAEQAAKKAKEKRLEEVRSEKVFRLHKYM